ncbi:MAG: 6-phosphogluconolactonase [Myxococcota bacterium]|jgi:6-phosphogluconolactonase|nr:6-phosphogluconolactonase [Myxococcota bacterium]
MSAPTIVVSDDPVREAAVRLRAALETHGPRLAISGGSALRVIARLFQLDSMDDRVAFEPRELVLTWVDERVVPRASSESNAGEAERLVALPRHVALLHDDELDAPTRAIARVERAIDEVLHGALDVTLLGLGEDGHVASLFPLSSGDASVYSWDSPSARVMLVERSPKPPSRRLTLTRSFLATAKTHVVFAVGAGKREAIARLRAGDPALPATGLDGVVVITDATGAGE